MSEYKIDKGIEMPASREAKYPFGEMEVGDSFFIPDKKRIADVRVYARNWIFKGPQALREVRAGYRFSIRLWEDGVRCWRVK